MCRELFSQWSSPAWILQRGQEKNTFQSITNPYDDSVETHVHHDLSRSKILQANTAIRKIKYFIRHRENPYLLVDSSKKLKNISSQVISHPDIAIKHLKFFELSSSKFTNYRNSVYIDRSALIHDTIHQFQLLLVDYTIGSAGNDDTQSKNSIKEWRISTKIFKTVPERLGSPQKAIK